MGLTSEQSPLTFGAHPAKRMNPEMFFSLSLTSWETELLNIFVHFWGNNAWNKIRHIHAGGNYKGEQLDAAPRSGELKL